MKGFLSCDWGTTAFRLRLVSLPDLTVVDEENSGSGIRYCYEEWIKTNESNKQARVYFYANVIKKHLETLKTRTTESLEGLPIVISGMASSSIGITELAYADTPFSASGSGAISSFIKAAGSFSHDMILISGLRSGNDVLRGEETQWLGCMDEWNEPVKHGIYIFPGTHSKHMEVENDSIIRFKTYMTGEFFELLSSRSVLQAALLKPADHEPDQEAFTEGLREAAGSELLHSAFKVRTNDLFHVFSKEKNYHYLSGLLIGNEIKTIGMQNNAQICVCAGKHLGKLYQIALKEYGLEKRTKLFPGNEFDKTVIKGQYKILMQQKEMIR
jgi:2-dehydro-3-deoxygalactonokinase